MPDASGREVAGGDPRTCVALRGGRVSFGPFSIAGSSGDAVLASVDISGTPRWLQSVEGRGIDVTRLAAGSTFVAMAGRYASSIDLGGGATIPLKPGQTFFVIRVDH